MNRRRVGVRDEVKPHVVFVIWFQGPGRHRGAKVGTSDADIDHIRNRFAGRPFPYPAPDRHRKGPHPRQNIANGPRHVLAIDRNGSPVGVAERPVQDRPIFGRVYFFAPDHAVPPVLQFRGAGQVDQIFQNLVGYRIFGKIEKNPVPFKRELPKTVVVVAKQFHRRRQTPCLQLESLSQAFARSSLVLVAVTIKPFRSSSNRQASKSGADGSNHTFHARRKA